MGEGESILLRMCVGCPPPQAALAAVHRSKQQAASAVCVSEVEGEGSPVVVYVWSSPGGGAAGDTACAEPERWWSSDAGWMDDAS